MTRHESFAPAANEDVGAGLREALLLVNRLRGRVPLPLLLAALCVPGLHGKGMNNVMTSPSDDVDRDLSIFWLNGFKSGGSDVKRSSGRVISSLVSLSIVGGE